MIGTEIEYNWQLRKRGRVILVYTDAIASGTNEYCPITMIIVKNRSGEVEHIYPRDICLIDDRVEQELDKLSKDLLEFRMKIQPMNGRL